MSAVWNLAAQPQSNQQFGTPGLIPSGSAQMPGPTASSPPKGIPGSLVPSGSAAPTDGTAGPAPQAQGRVTPLPQVTNSAPRTNTLTAGLGGMVDSYRQQMLQVGPGGYTPLQAKGVGSWAQAPEATENNMVYNWVQSNPFFRAVQ